MAHIACIEIPLEPFAFPEYLKPWDSFRSRLKQLLYPQRFPGPIYPDPQARLINTTIDFCFNMVDTWLLSFMSRDCSPLDDVRSSYTVSLGLDRDLFSDHCGQCSEHVYPVLSYHLERSIFCRLC